MCSTAVATYLAVRCLFEPCRVLEVTDLVDCPIVVPLIADKEPEQLICIERGHSLARSLPESLLMDSPTLVERVVGVMSALNSQSC